MKQFILLSFLSLVCVNTCGCFSISARSQMKDEYIQTFPGVGAYKDFVTRPFEELNAEESFFFGILILPHLASATVDLPLSFIVDSIMYSSDKKKVDEWENKPEEFFAEEWPELLENIDKTKLETALQKIDDVGFKKFWELLKNKTQKEKVLFTLLKFIDQSDRSSSRKYALKELKRFQTSEIIDVMKQSWWKKSYKSDDQLINYAFSENNKVSKAIGLRDSQRKTIWDFTYYPEIYYIFEMSGLKSSSFVVAVKNNYSDSYDIKILHGKPDHLKLPKVKIPRQELQNWQNGWGLSKWTEKHLPTELIRHFQFEKNKFGVPEVQ